MELSHSSGIFFRRLPALFAIALVAVALGCITGGDGKVSGNTTIAGSDNMATGRFAVIETNKGTIKAELYEKDAPITTKNFIKLAENGFYNGLKFHRYEPGFVIQGGDPKGDGTGGSNETIPLEINPKLTHVKGALAMARTSDPNSASSQFYITLADSHFLDGNYAVFGKVVEGMDVALKLRAGDKMTSVKIVGK